MWRVWRQVWHGAKLPDLSCRTAAMKDTNTDGERQGESINLQEVGAYK